MAGSAWAQPPGETYNGPLTADRPARDKTDAILLPPGTVIYFPNAAATKLSETHFALSRPDVEKLVSEVMAGRMARQALSECLLSAQEAVSPSPWWVTAGKIGGLTAALGGAVALGFWMGR